MRIVGPGVGSSASAFVLVPNNVSVPSIGLGLAGSGASHSRWAVLATVAASTSTGHEIAVSLNPAYHPVRLADLVNFDGEVTVTEDFEPSGDHLADFCGGGTWEHRTLALEQTWKSVADRLSSQSEIDWAESFIDWPKVLGLTEQRVAATLGISTERLGAESLRLWNATFSSERDRRAGPDANRQKRGQATRQLKAELQKAITDGND